jgi:hypothetical protein
MSAWFKYEEQSGRTGNTTVDLVGDEDGSGLDVVLLGDVNDVGVSEEGGASSTERRVGGQKNALGLAEGLETVVGVERVELDLPRQIHPQVD